MTAIRVGYAGVSTDGQERTAERHTLAALGVVPTGSGSTNGITGTHRQRRGLREALAACQPEGSLVVTIVDRLARAVPNPATALTNSPAASTPRPRRVPPGPHRPVARLLLLTGLFMVAGVEAGLAPARTRGSMALAKPKAGSYHFGRVDMFVARSTVYRSIQRAEAATTRSAAAAAPPHCRTQPLGSACAATVTE